MKQHQQANQYDKIVKENIEAIIPAFLTKVLGIHPVQSEEIPDDLQHTRERKPDCLKRITEANGQPYILHLEFQVADEPDMIYRMLDYCAMLIRVYRIPIRQYVIFLGRNNPKMTSALELGNLNYSYELVSISQLDYRLFLSSTRPEEVLLSVLSNFSNRSSSEVVNQIIRQIEVTSASQLAFQKHIRQLQILGQLRNLESIIQSIMDSIEHLITEERDFFYMRGQAKEQKKVIANLLQKTSFSVEEIADLVSVPIEKVEKIKKELNT